MNNLYDTLEYNEYFNRILQKQIRLKLCDKVIRQGSFVLYGYKNFQIEMYFKSNKDTKLRKTEIPIPFKISPQRYNPNTLILSYTLDSLIPEDIMLKTILNKPSSNKFFNNNLYIEVM